VKHFEFKYLLKSDDDTFVCLSRVANLLYTQPLEVQPRLYAGVPTACNQASNTDYMNGRVYMDPSHKWFDEKYVSHTMGALDCYPVYMQGAFYVMAQPLVEHLYRGHEHLECFINEDVTVGSWLLGVDRELLEIYNFQTSDLWECSCSREGPRSTMMQMFHHNCKEPSQLRGCSDRLLQPGRGC
ncbi:unnamed protein product, partial [Discosporangium mesarthrocarpum]